MQYIAVIHKYPATQYGISFPDFPGCISAGGSIEEAQKNAREALEMHIKGMREDGESIPPPSDFQKIMDSPEYADAAFVVIRL
jgi:predicted RNase H-like HicB family nuclease